MSAYIKEIVVDEKSFVPYKHLGRVIEASDVWMTYTASDADGNEWLIIAETWQKALDKAFRIIPNFVKLIDDNDIVFYDLK